MYMYTCGKRYLLLLDYSTFQSRTWRLQGADEATGSQIRFVHNSAAYAD
jgi:hypothetical protein